MLLLRKPCENMILLDFACLFLRHRAKKKGVNQHCCYASVSPNTGIHTTAKLKPSVVENCATGSSLVAVDYVYSRKEVKMKTTGKFGSLVESCYICSQII